MVRTADPTINYKSSSLKILGENSNVNFPLKNSNHLDSPAGNPLLNSSEPVVDLVQLALRNIFLLMLAGVLGVAMGVGVYRLLGPKYVADSKILVKLKNPMPIQTDGKQIVVGERSAHIEIIHSPKVVERAVRDSQLDQLPSLEGSDDPGQDIIDGLKITRIAGEDHHQLNILELQYTSKKREDSKIILTAVIKAYDEYLKDDAENSYNELSRLLKQINKELKPRLQEKVDEYQKFRESAPLIWKAPPGADAGPNDVMNIHQQRVQAIATERVKVELLRQEVASRVYTLNDAIKRGESREALLLLVKTFLMKEQQTNTQTVVTGESQKQQLDTQLLPLILEEQQLLERFDVNHPKVINVRERMQRVIDYYHQQGVDLPSTTVAKDGSQKPVAIDPVQTYLIALSQQEQVLNNRLEELEKLYLASTDKAKLFSRYEAKDQILSDELKRIKAIHDIVVNRIEELTLVRDKGYMLQQISPARAESDLKRIIKILGGCLIFVMASAYGLLFLREIRDTSLRSLGDLQNLTSVPILGALPAIANPSKNLEAARQTGLAPMLYYYHDPGSPEAEACRSVRSTFFVRTGDANARIVQFTSAEPSDGKTTCIANLAISIAQAGKKVLLIDADLRRPMIHRLFGLREDIGLSETLSGDIELKDALQTTYIENLSILTAGVIPPKPAELLSSAKLHYLLGEAAREYDFVLIDSPPVLAVSDPFILAQSVDAVMLVVRMHKNRRPSIKRALEQFEAHGIDLLGTIANGLQDKSGEYLYKGGYAGGYSSNPLAPKKKKLAKTT